MHWPIHPFPEIETKSFRLRKLNLRDAPEIFSLRSDDRVNEYLDRPKATSLDDAKKFIRKINTGIEEEGWLYWAIQSKSSEKIVGTICFWNVEPEKSSAEIGFELMPEHQGKGVMTEVLNTFLPFGFRTLKLKKIKAELHAANIKSSKILEKFEFKKSSRELTDDDDMLYYVLAP